MHTKQLYIIRAVSYFNEPEFEYTETLFSIFLAHETLIKAIFFSNAQFVAAQVRKLEHEKRNTFTRDFLAVTQKLETIDFALIFF